MRARTKPSRASFSSSWRYSPFRPRTMGARIMMRSPVLASSPCRMARTIWSVDWREIGLPQFGQCGVPIEL